MGLLPHTLARPPLSCVHSLTLFDRLKSSPSLPTKKECAYQINVLHGLSGISIFANCKIGFVF